MTRNGPLLPALIVLGALAGCQTREMFLGVAEPEVHGTASPIFAPEALTKLAVLVLPVLRPTEVRDVAAERAIADDVEKVLLGDGYGLVARADLGSVLAELAFQDHVLTDADVPRLGRKLGVPAVLVVAVTDDQLITQANDRGDRAWSYRLGMSAKLVDTAAGDILWVAKTDDTHYVESPAHRQEVLGPVVRGVAKSFPIRVARIAPP